MKLRRAGALGAVALGSALAALALTRLWIPGKLFQQVEETTLDWRSQARPSRPPGESPVVLVMFDSASVAEWPYLAPFPRGVLAELVEVVRRSGARAIGVDVLLDRRYPALDSLDGGEARLRGALRRAGNVVLVSITEDAGAGRVHLPPDPFFASVAAGVGVADLPTPYEPVRDGALAVDAGGRLHPGFATTLYALATGGSADSLLARAAAEGRFRFPGLAERWSRLPRRGTAAAVPLLFRGPPSRPGHNDRAFLAFSAADLLALGDAVPPEWFAGKVVLLGSGFHAEDRFRTPHYADNPDAGERGKLAGWTYGVELHATLLENLLTGSFPRALPGWAAAALLLGVALAAAAATFGAGIAWGATAALGLALLNAGVAFWAFGAHALVLPVAAPALAAALAFAGATSWVSIVEGREKRVIRAAFSRYLAPALVDELVDDPSRLRLGGEKRSVSILFCDLEGFTALAETRDPHEILRLLNRYLDEMSQVVIAERGTVDKFMGDAVMALFGAPNALPDHAVRACRAALGMQRRLAALNQEWRHAGWDPLRARVGVNTGTPVVGNIGGRERFDYTALGDAVNLAARLEPACRTYGVGVMISAATRAAAGEAVVVRELELLAVYGRTEPVAVFELVAMADEPPAAARAEVLEPYARGLEAFRRRDFEMALVYFGAALEADPGDGPAALYAGRCREYIANPPPAEWNFVERRQVK